MTRIGIAVLSALIFAGTCGITSTLNVGLYPALEVMPNQFAMGLYIPLGPSFLTTTYSPLADTLTFAAGSSSLGPHWQTGLTLTNLTAPPISITPFLGFGWFFSPSFAAYIRASSIDQTPTIGLLIVLRF